MKPVIKGAEREIPPFIPGQLAVESRVNSTLTPLISVALYLGNPYYLA